MPGSLALKVTTGKLSAAVAWPLVDPTLPVPNFFVVGAAKAGTTSIHAYLGQHRQVFMPTLKEPHYFSSFQRTLEFDNYLPVVRDPREYQALFEASSQFAAVGDASPSYLCDPLAASRIKAAIPNARIIISLRNPVDRAFSHYLMEYHEGRESREFAKALIADEGRAAKGWGVSFQYVELGLYADQVERYLLEFGEDRVLVVLFEELVRDTPAVMGRIAHFLGIDTDGFQEHTFDQVHNPFEETRGPMARLILRLRPLRILSKQVVPQSVRTAVRNRLLFKRGAKPKLELETRAALARRFEPDIQRLEVLLGRRLESLRDNH